MVDTTFVDPLGALAAMYESLAPNGVLYVDDNLTLHGLEGQMFGLVDYLSKRGHVVVARYGYEFTDDGELRPDRIFSLVIQKTHDHLELPVEYDGVVEKDGRQIAKYRASTNLSDSREFGPKTKEFLRLLKKQSGGNRKMLKMLVSMFPKMSVGELSRIRGEVELNMSRARHTNDIDFASDRRGFWFPWIKTPIERYLSLAEPFVQMQKEFSNELAGQRGQVETILKTIREESG